MYRRILIAYLLIILIGAGVLIYKIITIPDVMVDVTVEPIPVTVYTEVIMGTEPPVHEVKTVIDKNKLIMLASLIDLEAGSNWCSDEMQQGVGSVVLNRIKDSRFPDTMEKVIYQPGQYATSKRVKGHKPTERAIENARIVLTEGSIFPEEVVFQANFTQGKGVYKKVQNMYFCK